MSKPLRIQRPEKRVTGTARSTASRVATQKVAEASRREWTVRKFHDGTELFDADGLAESIASIIHNNPEAADELIFYLLIILDAVGEAAPKNVRQVIDQSVRSAFQFTETFEAALELYVLCQRGLLGGPLPARDLIREMVTSLGNKSGKIERG